MRKGSGLRVPFARGNLLIKGSAMFSPRGTTNLCNKEQAMVGEQINVMMATGHSGS